MAARSWFARAHMPMEVILKVTYGIAQGWKFDQIILEASDLPDGTILSPETVTDWYNYGREVMDAALTRRYQARGLMGGAGEVVEIDESKIGHMKYYRGRRVDGQWILGLINRTTGEMRVDIVPDRAAVTLLPIIQRHVAPNTTIMSDEWAAYQGLPNVNNYTHLTVNHTVNFVNPVTGAHTQRIESNWRALKARVCRGGVRRMNLHRHIAEYLWRRECLIDNGDTFKQLIQDISVSFRV